MAKQNNIIWVLLIVLFTGAGFFGGTKYQLSKIVSQRGQFGDRMLSGAVGNNTQANRMRLGGGQIVGEISAQDENTITVNLPDGSSKIILLSEKTAINKASQGLLTDLKVGEKVAIFGSVNTDGSVTAQNIQLNPIVGNTQITPPVQP
ncbi:MAG: DUF5666 domain-containing protein [Candidatus Shapirobacteria bacterium]|jgi:hypothetical protein